MHLEAGWLERSTKEGAFELRSDAPPPGEDGPPELQEAGLLLDVATEKRVACMGQGDEEGPPMQAPEVGGPGSVGELAINSSAAPLIQAACCLIVGLLLPAAWLWGCCCLLLGCGAALTA